LAEAPKEANPGEELRPVLESAGPLPPLVVKLLETRSAMGGTLQIRPCSAVVKPPSSEMLESIGRHPHKGYLEAGAPPGNLLIKSSSTLEAFMARCQELGFTIDFR